MKTTATPVDIVLHVSENFHGNNCSEVISKVVACQHGICYYSRLKFLLDLQNIEGAF